MRACETAFSASYSAKGSGAPTPEVTLVGKAAIVSVDARFAMADCASANKSSAVGALEGLRSRITGAVPS